MAVSESEFSISSSSSKSLSPGAVSPPSSPLARSGAPLNWVTPVGGAGVCANTGEPGTGGARGTATIGRPSGPITGAMMAWKVSGLSHSLAIIASRPASMRLAIAISPSRDNSLTGRISRRYIRAGKGAWRDNVFVERLWRSVKYEEVYLRAYDSVSEARASIGRYLDFYNSRRPHAGLDGITPDQAYFTPLPLCLAA